MQFFKMSYRNYSPWIWKFVRKDDYCLLEEHRCTLCGKMLGRRQKNENYYNRPLDAVIEKKGSRWADIIGSGECSFRIVSQRTLEIWESEGIGTFTVFPITILPPYPKKMTEPPPMYYRFDNEQMEGAEFDFEASGYLGVNNCSGCGFSFDYSKSSKLWKYEITPHILKDGTWSGANVFCTKYFWYMYCTERVVDCAAKHKMTNFEFVPLEIAGSAAGFRGVDYTAKNWRAKLVKQLEEFRKNFRPIDPATGQFVSQ